MSSPKTYLETYNADLKLLRLARLAILTHPKIDAPREDVESCVSRLSFVTHVGYAECLLRQFKDKPFARGYFKKQQSNDERIKSMMRGFSECGVEVNPDVLRDYRAIKALRNVWVHSALRDADKKTLVERRFPDHPNRLGELDRLRIKKNLETFIQYVLDAVYADVETHWKTGSEESERQAEAVYPLEDGLVALQESNIAKALIRLEDLPWVFLNNIKVIGEELAAGEIDESSARKLGEIAIESWEQYFAKTLTASGLSPPEITNTASTIRTLHEKRAYATVPLGGRLESWVHRFNEKAEKTTVELSDVTTAGVDPAGQIWDVSAPFGFLCQVLEQQKLDVLSSLKVEDVATALRTGSKLYKHFRSLGYESFVLFSKKLPDIDSERADDYRRIGSRALEIVGIKQLWKRYVDSDSQHHDISQYLQLMKMYNLSDGIGARMSISRGGERHE